MNFFRKKIINFENTYFGLDLGDLFVKVLQLEKDGPEDSVRAYSISPIPAGCIEEGRIIDKPRVIQAIKTAISTAQPKKINTRKVVCSLPESKIFLRVLSIPKMEEAEISEAIKWEIEASIPLSVDQTYYDWQLISEADGKQNILTVAISREIVDDILEVLEGANLEVYGLETESVATTRSLIDKSISPKKVSLLVDLGSKRTNFTVAEGDLPFFTSSIPFSSSGVTDVIAKTLGIGNEEAEKLKISDGVSCFNNKDVVFNALSAYLEGLSVEIEKTIDFYQNINNQSGKIERIIICGGANLKGLISYLAKRLKKEINIGDPWINLNFGEKLPIISKEKSVQFTNAIGLAMRKSDLRAGINLLPPKKKEELQTNERFKTILGWEMIIFSMALAFCGFILGVDYLLNFNLKAISGSKDNLNGPKYETIKYFESKFLEINAKILKISNIASEQLYWSNFFSKLEETVSDGVAISGIATNNLTVSFMGKAKTRDDLLLFKNNLEKETCFESIKLPLSDLVPKEDVVFQIDLKLKESCLRNK